MELPQSANGVNASAESQSVKIEADAIDKDLGSDARVSESDGQSDEEAQLSRLAATFQDQDELEKTVGRQADQMLLEQADERDKNRIEKTEMQRRKLQTALRNLQRRLEQPSTTSNASRIRVQIEELEAQIVNAEKDIEQINQRISDRHQDAEDAKNNEDSGGNRRMAGESQRDFLIRTGKITPFSRMGQAVQGASATLSDVMLNAEEYSDEEYESPDADKDESKPRSHQVLLEPGFAQDDVSSNESVVADEFGLRPRKKRKLSPRRAAVAEHEDSDSTLVPEGDAEYSELSDGSDSDAFTVVAEGRDDQPLGSAKKKGRRARRDEAKEDFTGIDDGDESVYQDRLRRWIADRSTARRNAQRKQREVDGDSINETDDAEEESEPEWTQPHPTRADTVLEAGLTLPGDIFPSLFDYQQTGVQWLWELYQQQVGGIVGDEMGLGKTIQIIAFLAGLHHSGKLNKPVIIVCPATVMKQWVNEFHRWWPPLRVSILHSSGSAVLDTRQERDLEDMLETKRYRDPHSIHKKPINRAAKRVVDRVVSEGHVLVTTYVGLQTYADLLIPIGWGYAVLDEGHKIRNPNAGITISCKELRTPNRIILSGTPIQNNLTELWSLFDFVFPMRLGNLVEFHNKFEVPIKEGGYANASNLQVETANKCAETLKDSISPYLIQRYKVDVAADLPPKKEQVLFCRITKPQREAYEKFLSSGELSSILTGKRQALYGIDILRKICNHPDLVEHRTLATKPGYNYGNPHKSGKMQVVKDLLQLWKTNGHKTLLFSQQVIMLDILERFIANLGGFKYRRMDGTTLISDRQALVDEFNKDPSINLFLLTTKVGGLGINLTGADRVIIYDPDWNPSTDIQARERAWRLGQKREVRIYRLMTVGTIEEKIYHRQIFKQFLTNKILRDPKQRQTFQLKDLHDLFTLGDTDPDSTETSTMFRDTQVKVDDDKGADAAHIDAMAGVSKRELFHEPEAPAPQPPSDANSAPAQNTRLLSAIFTPALDPVHSAHSHESIMSTPARRRPVAADPDVIAREAKKVAAQAARTLARALQDAKNTPAGMPTWTGSVGIAGRPEEPEPPPPPPPPPRSIPSGRGAHASRRGPSSSAILSNLSRPNASPSPSAPQSESDSQTFLTQIRAFLLAHGGFAYTQMLVDHFNRQCTTPARTQMFKEMLREIAVLERAGGAIGRRGRFGRERGRSEGRARWVLKKDFGGSA